MLRAAAQSPVERRPCKLSPSARRSASTPSPSPRTARNSPQPCGDGLLRVWNLNTAKSAAPRRSRRRRAASTSFTSISIGSCSPVSTCGSGMWRPIRGVTSRRGRPWARRLEVSPGGEYLVEVDQTRSTDWSAGRGLLVRDDIRLGACCRRCRGRRTRPAASPSVAMPVPRHRTHSARWAHRPDRSGAQWGHYTTNDYDYVVHLREFPSGTGDQDARRLAAGGRPTSPSRRTGRSSRARPARDCESGISNRIARSPCTSAARSTSRGCRSRTMAATSPP